jgi:KDO2-lipid IV(A) lauroyltransferase
LSTKSFELENEIPFLDIKGRATYIAIKGIIFFLSYIPDLFFKILCWSFYLLLMIFGKKQKEIIRKNVMFIYDLPAHSSFSKNFVKQVIKHQVYSSLESFRFLKRYDTFEFSGLDEFKENLEACGDKGVVAIAAHIGAWELLARITPSQTKKTFYAVAKPSKNTGMSKVLNDIRNENGTELLWSGQSSLARDMQKVLKEGHILGMVMDQKPKKRQGPEVEFLGRKTTFVAGPATMSMKTNAETFSFFCVREGYLKYRLVTSHLRDVGDDLNSRTQRYATEIERVIKLYPEQWCWNYRRWNLEEEKI